MVIHSVIAGILRPIAGKAFRQLYRAVNLQDKLIEQSWSRARIIRPIRQGIRHGAGGGAIAGIFIEQNKNTMTENGLQTPYVGPSSRPFNKTYRGQPRRYSSGYKSKRGYRTRCRCPTPRRRY